MSRTGQPDTPLSIVFVSAQYPPALGGAEGQAEALARKAGDAGHHVMVITQKLKGMAAQKEQGVMRLAPAVGGRLSSTAFGLRLISKIVRLRPDLIQVFLLSSPALFCGIAGRLAGCPVVAKMGGGGDYGDVVTSRKNWLSRVRLRLVARLVTDFVVPSGEAAAELISLGIPSSRCLTIPNGVDLSIFRPPESRRTAVSSKTVVFAGRLEREKDPQTLLEAWAEVMLSYPEARLLIIGEGSLGVELRHRAESLGLSGAVIFTGKIPGDEMVSWYAKGSVFALPSLSEGLSNSLLEAMACGQAPVVSDIPANRAVFSSDGSAALFFPPGRPDKLAACLVKLLGDQDMLVDLSRRAVQLSGSFSLDSTARTYIHLWKQLTMTNRDAGETRTRGAQDKPPLEEQ